MHRVAVSAVFFIGGFIYSSWVSRLPRLQELHGLSNITVGQLLLVMAIGGLIAMPVSGAVIVRYGSHKITIVGAIGICLVIPFIAFTPHLGLLFIVFFAVGALNGIKDVAMNAQAVICEENLNKPIMSSFHAIWSGGMIIGAGAGSLANKFEISIHTHLIALSITAFILVVWAKRYFIPDKPENTDEPLFSIPDKRVWLVGFIAFCAMMGEGAMADWSANYLENVSRVSEAISPLGLAIFSVAMTTARFLGDGMRSKFGDAKLLLMASGVSLIGIVCILATNHLIMALIGFFVCGLGLSIIVPIAYSIAGKLPNMPSGKGISMVTTIGYSGFLFGPPIIGYLADIFDMRIAMSSVGIMFLIMSILSIRNYKPNLGKQQ